MITIPADKYSVIPLGRLGENERTRILFKEAAEWVKEYPNLEITLINQAPTETPNIWTTYAVPADRLEMTDEGLYWTVTNTELAHEGDGECELVIYQGLVVAKSKIYSTKVLPALDGNGEAPEPWEDWYAEFVALERTVLRMRDEAEEILAEMRSLQSQFARLDEQGKIPEELIPSKFDDVLEYSNYNQLPFRGESGKIYITTDTSRMWRWNGSSYIELGGGRT